MLTSTLTRECSECTNTEPRLKGFRLSDSIRDRGYKLSDIEAAILDAAQTLCRTFKDGGAVSFKQVCRLVRRYHYEPFAGSRSSELVKRLIKAGLWKLDELGTPDRKLRLVDPINPPAPRRASRYSKLVNDPMQEALLLACHHCIERFYNRNVASRRAVAALMLDRHSLTRSKVNRLIRKLIAAGVLELHESKGHMGLRLTETSVRILKGTEPKDMTPTSDKVSDTTHGQSEAFCGLHGCDDGCCEIETWQILL